MPLTVGQIIGKALKAYGVPHVAGLPGHGNWSLIDAFNDPVSKLPFIQVMDEQSAVHIADAHFRVRGQPIAAWTSIGPGATNTIIGLATAHCASTALLLITGERRHPCTAAGLGIIIEVEGKPYDPRYTGLTVHDL